jgi:L-alanine-DL-glutamate epimerase-like enolase superfamily enzyme
LESDLGTATCVQLAAAFKQISLPCEIAFYDENFGASMIKEPLVIQNGCLQLPEGPGSGVNINWDSVEEYKTKI